MVNPKLKLDPEAMKMKLQIRANDDLSTNEEGTVNFHFLTDDLSTNEDKISNRQFSYSPFHKFLFSLDNDITTIFTLPLLT